jgi:hypothetical protein
VPVAVLADYPLIRTLNLGTEAHLTVSDMAAWRALPTIRGEGGRVLPGVDGVAPRPVKRGPVRIVHQVHVSGWVDPDGVAISNPDTGLETNLGLLNTAIAPATSAPWTFQVSHVRSSGTRTAQATVLDVTTPREVGDRLVVVGLDILIPSGVFT